MEINPADAAEIGVGEGDLVRLTSRRNSLLIAVRVSDRVAKKQVFVPFHFREAAANLLTSRSWSRTQDGGDEGVRRSDRAPRLMSSHSRPIPHPFPIHGRS